MKVRHDDLLRRKYNFHFISNTLWRFLKITIILYAMMPIFLLPLISKNSLAKNFILFVNWLLAHFCYHRLLVDHNLTLGVNWRCHVFKLLHLFHSINNSEELRRSKEARLWSHENDKRSTCNWKKDEKFSTLNAAVIINFILSRVLE